MSRIIITGSTRGIGRGLAEEFLRRGHQVVINGRKKEAVDQAVRELAAGIDGIDGIPEVEGVEGAKICGFAGSAAEKATHQGLVRQAVEAYGGVDYYINNAGIPNPYKAFVELEPREVRNLVDTNIFGLMIGTGVAAKHMIEQGSGRIFNMEGFGSDGRMREKLTLYGTSKRAVNYFTRSIAKELEGSGIQVGMINPGMVRTGLIDSSMEHGSEKEKKQFEKVYRILAEEVETVAPFLVEGMLKSRKNGDRVSFLSGTRLMIKILRMIFS